MTTATLYGPALQSLFNAEVDYDTHTIKVLLVDDSYTPNIDTHRYLSDVTGQVTGTGYTAGGATLTAKTATYDAPTNTLRLDAADVEWADATIEAYGAVIYDDTPSTAATKPLLVWIDFEGPVSSVDAPFTIEWAADGIVTVSLSA